MPEADEIVETAAAAAEDVIFSRLETADVTDLDVTVRFEDEVLEVDVYLDTTEGSGDADRIADDAALAARAAVDDLFEAGD